MTDRDLLLFRYLFEEDFVSRDLIKKYIWRELSDSYVTHRLWRMTKEGYVKKYPDIRREQGTVLMAGKEAVKMVRNDTIRKRMRNLDIDQVQFYNSDIIFDHYEERDDLNKGTFEHDLMVTEVRLILERLSEIDYWVSQRLLWKHNYNASDENKYGKIADGLVKWRDYILAVELENNLKKQSRYDDIFKTYNKDKGINGVLYITTNDRIFKKLQVFTKKPKKFYIADMSNIRKGILKFSNSKSTVDLRK